MTSNPEQDVPRDDPLIAAEWSLGLLEGDELLAARGKHAIDPDFAWRKEWWDNWFAPLADEIAPAEPGPHVWQRIAATINAPAPLAPEVITLKARVKRWQIVSGLTSVAAAIALMVSIFGPAATPPPAPAPAAPLVANVTIGDGPLRLDVTYLPASEQMLVSAIGLTADGVHDHELWLVPQGGGALQSLGVIAPGEVRAMSLAPEIARNLGDGAQLVLTREPLGGKPAGAAAGPVVARGALQPV
ncbi:MAG: anti-sigma factor domain-containing protein [Erythrobacter sp.]